MFLANILFRTAQLHGAKPSFIDGKRAFTWLETLMRVRRLAGALAQRQSKRVAIIARNSIEYLELTFACPIAGVTFVPMNTRLAPPEMRELLRNAAPEILFVDAEHAPAARVLLGDFASAPLIVGWGGGDADISFDRFANAEPIDPVAVSDEDDWAIIFTGGTTGLPKGVRVPRRAFSFNVLHILRDLDWGASPRYLQVTPLFHLAALGPSYAVAAWGGSQHLLPEFSMDRLLKALSEHHIEAVSLVPTMIGWLMARQDLHLFDLEALRAIGYGASAIPESLLQRTLERFPHLKFNQFYGQTESGGALSTLTSAGHFGDRLRSAGQPIHGVRLAIKDEDGNDVPQGTWGEICAQTPGLFSGYIGDPKATAAAVLDGWLRTGDVGFLDGDGYLYVTDRLKDMIVTGAENVSSSEVESAILRHPAVAQSAVIAVPDDDWGERVHAFIRLNPGAMLSEAEIIGHCRTLIAGYKCPKSISFVDDELPLSAIGKVRKDLLRERTCTVTTEASSYAT